MTLVTLPSRLYPPNHDFAHKLAIFEERSSYKTTLEKYWWKISFFRAPLMMRSSKRHSLPPLPSWLEKKVSQPLTIPPHPLLLGTREWLIHDVNSTSHSRIQAFFCSSSKRRVVVFESRWGWCIILPKLHASTHKETLIFVASRYLYPIVHFHFHFHFVRKTLTRRQNMT